MEMQFDRTAAAVLMANARDFRTNRRIDSKFFVKFTNQSINRIFTWLELASGKFSLQRHRLIFGALANQELALASNQRSTPLPDFRPRRVACGQARGSALAFCAFIGWQLCRSTKRPTN